MKMKYLRMANEHILALLIPLLRAAPLVLPVFGAHAGVIITRLYSFNAYNDGCEPQAALVQASDGNFYGTTYSCGAYGAGTVFKISPHGAYTHLYSFTGTNDGWGPTATLVQASDGSFYGTTSGGGSLPGQDGNGTVFKISTNGTLTSLHSFTGGNDGFGPSGLVQGSDGNFYGTTFNGNPNRGTVFQITPAGTLTSLYSFTGGADGGFPTAGLTQGNDGNFYGVTSGGGMNNAGTVFQITPAGALTSLYSFSANGEPTDGRLVQGSDGNFYGTTYGGPYGAGTAFQITPTGALTNLYSFGAFFGDEMEPYAGLVQGSDGSFYGTTYGGGLRGFGTVFRLTIAPPQLTITPSEPNVILSWPTNYVGFDYSGYILQSTTNLGSLSVWTTNLPSPVVVNGQYTVTNPIARPRQFYRLVQ